MRITDNRYNRYRARFDLALRMMGYQARTSTVRRWTGLSEDHIRKLYRFYLSQNTHSPGVYRRRGKAPRKASYFLQSAAMAFESSVLAALLHAAGLVPLLTDRTRMREGYPVVNTLQGQEFFLAYDTYLQLCPKPRLSFEHAWFLTTCLYRGDLIRLSRCGGCGRLHIVETNWLADTCGCGKRGGTRRRGRLPPGIIRAWKAWKAGERNARAAVQSEGSSN